MATIEQATIYNTVRKNEQWDMLTPNAAQALLTDAEDYIRNAYSIRSYLTADEGRILDSAIYRLAATFQTIPPQVANTAALKSEKKEGAGFKKEVEYFAASGDPYPYITALVSRLQDRPAPGLFIGKVTQ